MMQDFTNTGGPRWSVMIPTYRRTDFLAEAIRSVMSQRGASGYMEVVVVDNASETSDIEQLVQEVGGGAVRFVRNERNLGAAGNWDRCVEFATGELIHILHDDDRVLPGFYEAMDSAMRSIPSAGMAVGSAWFIDGHGERMSAEPSIRVPSGIWSDFARIAASKNPVVCPGVVVRRDVFKSAGPFRADLDLIPDWEMWARIGENHQVVSVSEPLVEYRLHAKSNYDAAVRGLKWCREIRDMVLELHRRQGLQTEPSFGFVLVWGGRAVTACFEREHSWWKAAGVAWGVFRLVPGAYSARWLLRQCWSLIATAPPS